MVKSDLIHLFTPCIKYSAWCTGGTASSSIPQIPRLPPQNSLLYVHATSPSCTAFRDTVHPHKASLSGGQISSPNLKSKNSSEDYVVCLPDGFKGALVFIPLFSPLSH